MHKILEMIDRELQCIEDTNELNPQNIEVLGKLVDIKKDIYKIEGMEGEEEMRYYDDNYGARRRDSRGRYMAGRGGNRGGNRGGGRGGSYGEMYLNRMYDGYEDYMDGMENYRESGNYGEKDKGMEALEYMLEGAVGFFEHLQESAESPEEMELVKKYARKIKEM